MTTILKWHVKLKEKLPSGRICITALVLVGLLLTGSGCKNTSPEFYSIATATAVSYGLRNSPNTATFLRGVQPVACALSVGTNLNPAEITSAIESYNFLGDSPEGRAIINGVLLLYISAYDNLGSNTNATAVRPYTTSVFCDGFKAGLDGAPTKSRARSKQLAPPNWPLLRP